MKVCRTSHANDLNAGHAIFISSLLDEVVALLVTRNSTMLATFALCLALLTRLSELLSELSFMLAQRGKFTAQS